jgi:hypothetical protein
MWDRLLMEQPFRVFTRTALKYLATSVRTKCKWDLSSRPGYMLGVLSAADQANRQGVNRISVIEFGVAGGNGLLELERIAALVEKELGVHIDVVGFDMGPEGLPMFVGDHRDHPDKWKQGDFPMEIYSLLKKIYPRTKLIIGNVKTSVEKYIDAHNENPIGFVSFDMDLYSSTTDALRLFMDQRVKRGGPRNSDSVISGSLASPKPPGGGKPEERGDEENETQSRSGIQGPGGLGSVQGRQDAGRTG